MNELSIFGTQYHFDNDFFHKPKKYGPITLLQAGEVSYECGFTLDPHVQICEEISYIVSGNGNFYVNEKQYAVKKGNLFVNQTGETHRIEAARENNLRFLYVGFQLDANTREGEIAKLSNFYTNLQENRIQTDRLNVPYYFSNLVNEIYAPSEFSHNMIYYYLMQVLILTYRNYNEKGKTVITPPKDANVVGRTVYSMINYIDNHIMDIDNIGSIAKNLGYSDVYLSHLFHNKTGMTLRNYVTYKKIEKSLEMIENKRMSITQIALMLNFSTVQSFCKAFKRILGFSPTQYKNQS